MTKSSEVPATTGEDEQEADGNAFTFDEVMAALRAETDKLQPDNALLEGAAAGDHAKVATALENGASKAAVGHYGDTPVHLAALSGNRGLVQFLLAQQFPADLTNNLGFTPLYYAVRGKNADVADDLALAGGNVNHATPRLQETLLMIAAYYDVPDVVQCLLKHGARVDEKDSNGATAFMRAAGEGNLDCLTILMDAGADPYLKSNSGNTAFTFAKRKGGAAALESLTAYVTEYTERVAREGSAKPVSTMKTISLKKTEYIPNG